MFERTFFFLLSFSCVRTTFKLQPIENHFFLSFSLCQNPLHIQGNFRWSKGGQVPPRPPLAPPLLATVESIDPILVPGRLLRVWEP